MYESRKWLSLAYEIRTSDHDLLDHRYPWDGRRRWAPRGGNDGTCCMTDLESDLYQLANARGARALVRPAVVEQK